MGDVRSHIIVAVWIIGFRVKDFQAFIYRGALKLNFSTFSLDCRFCTCNQDW